LLQQGNEEATIVWKCGLNEKNIRCVKHWFMDKSLRNIPPGKPKTTREDNIKMNLYAMGCEVGPNSVH
jgi:hypothetical protein